MRPVKKRRLFLAALTAAFIMVAALTACELKTYNMTDSGKPSDAVNAFLQAVLEGDDEKANELLNNYSWNSCKPQGNPDSGGYTVNGIAVSGSDASVMNCLMKSRSCRVVSQSDYTKDDLNSAVTVEYTSFDISKFQKELASRAVKEVKEKQYLGKVFKNEKDTKELIEGIKTKLLQDPQSFYTTQKYRIEFISVKGKWKVIMTEDFYKALTGYPN